VLKARDFGFLSKTELPDPPERSTTADHTLPQAQKNLEKEMIISILEKVHGNKSEAARLLGINRQTLYNKLKKFGLFEPGKK